MLDDVIPVDVQIYIGHIVAARVEADVFQQLFKHGVEPAGADVFLGLVKHVRSVGDCVNGTVLEGQKHLIDGQQGLMQFAGDATLLYYLMDEAQEGKNAFLEKRDPDFDQFPQFP